MFIGLIVYLRFDLFLWCNTHHSNDIVVVWLYQAITALDDLIRQNSLPTVIRNVLTLCFAYIATFLCVFTLFFFIRICVRIVCNMYVISNVYNSTSNECVDFRMVELSVKRLRNGEFRKSDAICALGILIESIFSFFK